MRTAQVVALAALCASCKLGGGGSADGGGSGSGGLMSGLAGLVGFEGEIDMVSSSSFGAGSSVKLSLTLKKDKMRVELPGLAMLGMVLILDAGKKKMWWLTPASKTFMELPMAPPSKVAPPSKPLGVKTGKSDKVAGYSCDEWQAVDPVSGVKTVACVSSGLSFLALAASPLADLGFGDWMAAIGTAGLPLRAETFDSSGALMSRMEATRIDKKSEADTLFEVPPGFTAAATPLLAPSAAPAKSAR